MADVRVFSSTLGLAELLLAYRVYKSNAGTLWMLLLFLYWDGIAHLMPAELDNPMWWRYAWAPLAILRLALAAGVSVDLFRFLHARTHRAERRLIGALAGSAAGLLIVAGWDWTPENWFQAVAAIRQYALLGLAAGTSAAWAYLSTIRPIDAPSLVRRHARLWCAWLWLSVAGASTAKGGLWWRIYRWEDGAGTWRAGADAVLVCMLILILGWWVSLRTPRSAGASRGVAGPSIR